MQRIIGIKVIIATALVAGLASSSAFAQVGGTTRGSLSANTGGGLDKRLAGKRILKRDTIEAMRSHTIKVDGRNRTIGELSAKLFREQDAFTAEMKRGKSALLGNPIETSEAIELENSTILIKSTRVVIVAPAKLASLSPRFKKQRSTGPQGIPSVSELRGGSAKEFASFKAGLSTRSANHPLRLAAALGDAALLKAISEGKGELTVTTEVVLPKKMLAVLNGTITLPTESGGQLDYRVKRSKHLSFSTDSGTEGIEENQAVPTSVTRKGEVNFTAKFLTGKTIGDSFQWSRTWKFPSGYFRLSAGTYYGLGLRAPVEVTGVMTPRKWIVKGEIDKKKHFDIALSGKTLDANAAYYRKVGLDEAKIFNGKELVIEAGFHVGYHVKAGWGILKKSGSIGTDFDFGKDFMPPYGNCGNHCGFEMWIPPELTHSGLHIGSNKIFVEGSVQLGFHVGGTGGIDIHYESIYGDGKLKSSLDGNTKMTHLLTLKGAGKKRLRTDLPIMGKPGTRNYGVRLWDPSYKWDLKVKPGVKATVQVKAGNWINQKFIVGPLWLDALGIDLGSVALPHHRGTTKSYKIKRGEKIYSR